MLWLPKTPKTCRTINIWPSFRSRGASSSAMGTITKPARCSSSPIWRARLKRIAANPDDFYHGAMARELAASMQKGGGLITADDLAHYEVKEREAVRGIVPRIRHHQRAAAVVGRNRADRDPEHSRRLRPGQIRRPVGAGGASDAGSLPARVFRSRRVSGRSGLFQNSRGPVDRQAIWRGLAGID